jgi:hypothetical protein
VRFVLWQGALVWSPTDALMATWVVMVSRCGNGNPNPLIGAGNGNPNPLIGAGNGNPNPLIGAGNGNPNPLIGAGNHKVPRARWPNKGPNK